MNKIKTFLIDLGNSNLEYYELRDNSKLLNQQFIKTEDIDQQILNEKFSDSVCVISSVVPEIDILFSNIPNAKIKSFDYSNISYLNINITSPSELGSDRIISASAAFRKYQKPTLIIDSGTALTFCFVDETRTYQGGIIFPGLKISSKALNDYTAKVPLIFVSNTTNIIGKTTKEAVEVGLFHGFKYLINGFINEYKKKYPNLMVVATGSAISVLQPFIDVDIIEPKLIFLGLRDLYLDSLNS